MPNLTYRKIEEYITRNVVSPFYKNRLNKLKRLQLGDIVRRKNPYLFKAKNVTTAGDFVQQILDAFLSSQEETLFGDLLENLSIYICGLTYGGKKAEQGKYPSVDLIFSADSNCYIVGIKSGPNWGNSDQVNRMKRNFKKAKILLKKEGEKKKVISVDGCMYGRDRRPHKKDKNDSELNYYKYCGQEFWQLISGKKELYKDIIKPLDKQVKKRDEQFKKLYAQKVNQLTESFLKLFCDKGIINWEKILEFVSKKSN